MVDERRRMKDEKGIEQAYRPKNKQGDKETQRLGE